MTEITGHLVDASGLPAEGHAVVSWPAFTVYGNAIAGGHKAFEIFGGDLDLTLYPNGPAQPAGTYYTVRFELQSGIVYDEYWIVPDTPSAALEQVRVSFPVAPGVAISPSQLTGAGAEPGEILTWNGSAWVGQFISTENIDPNYLQFAVDAGGTDFSVTGSPTVLGGTAVFHLPSASPAARGLVTTGVQTFGGDKTFADRLGVGIAPTHKLDVSGNCNVTGSYMVNGVPISIGGGHAIQDEGTPLPARAGLNFVGTTVSATDDPGNGRTVVTIAGAQQSPWTQSIDAANFDLLNVGLNLSHSANMEWRFVCSSAQPIVFYTSNTERMRIMPDGNVGISTASTHGSRVSIIPGSNPTDPVFGPQLRLGEPTNNSQYGALVGFILTGGAWHASLQSVAAAVGAGLLLNAAGGRVGIGVGANPAGALHVNNDVTGERVIYLNQTNATWGSAAMFNGFRYIETSSFATDGMFKAFIVGAGGVGIAAAPPVYGSNDALYVGGNVGIGTITPAQTLQVVGTIGCTDLFLENTGGTAGVTFRLDGFANWMHYWWVGAGGHRFLTGGAVRLEISDGGVECYTPLMVRNVVKFLNTGGTSQFGCGPFTDLNAMEFVWSNNNFSTITRLGYWHPGGLTILGSFGATGVAQVGNLGVLGGAYALDDGGDSSSMRILQQAGAIYIQFNKSSTAAARQGRINLGVVHTTNTYASDVAAGAAGLTRGDVYSSADGILRVKG
ncbi:MAG: hypothetical protein ABWY12_09740 [Burkholderiales bacterium]